MTKMCSSVYAQGYIKMITIVRFSKMLARFTKKSPGQPARTCHQSDNPTVFHGWRTRYNCLRMMNPSRANIKVTL